MASNRFPKHLFTLPDLWFALEEGARISGEREFIVAGSQALLGSLPEGPEPLRMSTDIDMYSRNPVSDDIQRLLIAAGDIITPFAREKVHATIQTAIQASLAPEPAS